MDGIQYPGGLGEEIVVELIGRGDPVPGPDYHRRRVQIVEAQLGDVLSHVLQEGATGAGIAGEDHPAGLADALDDLGVIQGHQGVEVDDLRLQTVLLAELLGGVYRAVQGRADGDDGQVLALADQVGVPDGDLIPARRHAALVELLAHVVNALALEEHHRVRSIEGGLHEALGLPGGGGEADLQAGDVGAQGGPVLAVLGAVLGAHGHPQHHGHLQDAGGHGLPLAQLVEDLVSRAADEVGVHQLHDDAAAAHAVAHGGTHDGGLGDGGVEQAVAGDGIRHAPVDGEGAAPVADVLSVGHQGRILVEFVQDDLADAVPEVEELHLAHGLAVLGEGGALLALDLLPQGALLLGGDRLRLAGGIEGGDLLVGEHEPLHVGGIVVKVGVGGHAGIAGVLADPGHTVHGLRHDLLEAAVGSHPRLHQGLAVGDDGVDGPPGLDLLLGAVGVLVGGGVAGEAVGDGVQQHGALALPEKGQLALHSVDDRQGVVAVDALGVELGGRHAGAHPGQHVVGHGLSPGLAAHTVGVVEDVVEDGHPLGLALLPQGVELVHAGKVHGLPHGAPAQGAVADVAHHDALLLVALLEQGRAGGDGGGAAHDGVVGVDAEGQEEGVHRPAHAVVEPIFTGEDLRQRAVDQEADGQLLDILGGAQLLHGPEGAAPQEVLHDLHQLLIAQLLNAAQALGQNFAVAAVAAEGVIAPVQQVGLSHGGGLLSQGQVGGAGIGGLDAVVDALGLDLVQHGLKFPQDGDVPPDAYQVLVPQLLPLIGHGLAVGVDGDVLKVDGIGSPQLVGINK